MQNISGEEDHCFHSNSLIKYNGRLWESEDGAAVLNFLVAENAFRMTLYSQVGETKRLFKATPAKMQRLVFSESKAFAYG